MIGFSLGFTLVWTLPVYQPEFDYENIATGYDYLVTPAGDQQGAHVPLNHER